MHTILLYIYMIGLAIGIGLIFDKKVEETMPVSIFITILIEYLVGIITKDLRIAYFTTVCISIVIMLVALFIVIKKRALKHHFRNNVLTNGFFVFTVSFFWIYVISRGMVVREFDEYSHWATVVKNMTYFDRFGNYEFSTGNRMFPGYPPGVSLWQYFCCNLYGKYHEGTLYQAMDLMLISCILPICVKFDFKKIIQNCVVYGVLIFISFMSYKSLYSSLYVDALLGFVMVYALLLIYEHGEEHNKFLYFAFISSLAVLCLIKASGAFLAIIVAVILLVEKVREQKKGILCTLLSSVSFMILGKISWSAYLKSTATRGAWNTNGVAISGLVNLFKGDGKEYQYTTMKNFWTFLCKQNLTGNRVCLSYIELTLILVILLIFIFYITNKEKKWLVFSIGLLLGQAIYTIGMLVLYLFTFSETEAVALASNDRYLNTYFVAFYLFVIMVMITREYKVKGVEYTVIIGLALFVIVANWSRINEVTIKYRQYEAGLNYVSDKYEDLATSSSQLDYRTDSIGVVTLEEDAFENIAVYHYMTPIELNMVYDFAENGKNRNLSVDEWMDDILSHDKMSHLYLLNIDADFISKYSECFDTYPEKGMYRIDRANKKIVKCD